MKKQSQFCQIENGGQKAQSSPDRLHRYAIGKDRLIILEVKNGTFDVDRPAGRQSTIIEALNSNPFTTKYQIFRDN